MAATKSNLEVEVKALTTKVERLQRTIGTIRKGVGQLVVPRDQADTIKKVIEIIDKAIDRS